MNKYTAAEFLGGETGLENADKKNGDFCFTHAGLEGAEKRSDIF